MVATAGLVNSGQLVTSEAQSRASEQQMCIDVLGLSYLTEHSDLQVHFLQMLNKDSIMYIYTTFSSVDGCIGGSLLWP